MARARKSKSNTVKVNFKGVESRQTPPEGDYKMEVLEATSEKGPSGDMIVFVSEISEGKYKGTKAWLYCPLQENSLWKLHAFLTALGEDVPEDDMDIDLGDLVGKEFVGVLTHETYQGKKKAKLTDFASLEDYEGELAGGDDDDDDEDDKKSKSKKSKGKSKSDENDDDDKPAKKSSKKKSSKDDDEDEDDKPAKKGKAKSKKSSDDDEDDEDEKPKSKSKGKAKKTKKVDKSDVEDMDEDELQELIDKHDLDVDLDDFKKLPKKVAAVIDALEEEDLLAEDD